MEGVTNCAESSTVGLRQVRVRGITFAPDVWMKCDVQSLGPDSCAVVKEKDREEEECTCVPESAARDLLVVDLVRS